MLVNIMNKFSNDLLVFPKVLKIYCLLSCDRVQCLLKDFQILLRGNKLAEGHVFIDYEIALIQRDWLIRYSGDLLLNGLESLCLFERLKIAPYSLYL